MTSSERPHVLIVGAGFGGLYAAKALKNAPVRITVIDRRNHHLFQPLLYQVATAGLSPGDIAYPIRAVLGRQKNVRVLLAEAVGVDLASRKVKLRDGEISYDYLILSPGVRHAYFGHNDWERWAPGLKTLEDALEIRRRILLAFERAEREPEEAPRHALLTFVVVGGGPTGVELAGAIAEISRQVMVRDFRAIDPREARIVLIEGGPRILPTYPEDLSTKAEAQLKRLGVEVWTNSVVTSVDASGVVVAGQKLRSATTLWAAGVEASPLARRVLAGGQSLVPIMAFRLAKPAHLVDINEIEELGRIASDGKTLSIGALVRHAAFHKPVVAGPLGALLTQVARHIAHYPIRTRGTFCGSCRNSCIR